jgi:hypothetical protein
MHRNDRAALRIIIFQCICEGNWRGSFDSVARKSIQERQHSSCLGTSRSLRLRARSTNALQRNYYWNGSRKWGGGLCPGLPEITTKFYLNVDREAAPNWRPLSIKDLDPLFTCQACGLRGAEVRADFNWASKQNSGNKKPPPGWFGDGSRLCTRDPLLKVPTRLMSSG